MVVKAVEKKRLWTYDELVAKTAETNQPTELWEGELIMTPAPAPKHQEVVARLARALSDHIAERDLGRVYFAPVDVVLTQRRVVQPDILYISNAKRAIIQDRIRGAPDLVVEVVSQGTWRRDHVDKKALYEQFGVLEYWIVDPEAMTIEVFGLARKSFGLVCRAGSGEIAASRLLVGFKVSVDEMVG